MEKKPFLRKGFAIGIVLIFIGLSVAPIISGTGSRIRNQEIVDYENSALQVIITKPENGIYFNNHKILPFSVPLVLCGDITIEVVVSNGSGLGRIEFYIHDALIKTIEGPGPIYEANFSWGPFSKFPVKVITYSFNESASDEITIWRLFR